MGIRFRKSIKMPMGFRINISKSGIGYSYGFKGYRHTVMANGRNRDTISIPKTGISYVTEHSRSNSYHENDNYDEYIDEVFRPTTLIENEIQDQIDMTTAKYKLLCKLSKLSIIVFILMPVILAIEANINRKYIIDSDKLTKYTLIMMIIVLITFAMKIRHKKKKRVMLTYELDATATNAYEKLKANWRNIFSCNNIWMTKNKNIYSSKIDQRSDYNNIEREKATLTTTVPWFISTNIDIIGIKTKSRTMYILPDKIMVLLKDRVIIIKYNELTVKWTHTFFKETDIVPKDAEVTRHEWMHANKDGSRDKRYNSNMKVPICKYGIVVLAYDNIITSIIVSNYKVLAETLNHDNILFMTRKEKL